MKTSQTIEEKLDIDHYINTLQRLFARQKSIALQGDSALHLRFIQALSKCETLLSPPELISFEEPFSRLGLQGILHVEELFAIVQMIDYLKRVRSVVFEEPVASWLRKLEVPDEITQIQRYFTDEGHIDPACDEELWGVVQALDETKKHITSTLRRLMRSAKIEPFLVDSQVHFYGAEECLLVRSGFGNALQATVVGRTQGGYFYVVPHEVSRLKEKQSALLSQKEAIERRLRKNISATFSKWLKFLRFADAMFDRFDHYRARIELARLHDTHFVAPVESKSVILKDFAHPAIKDPVALNVTFDRSILLVTGVNAGGKTMLLKSILSAVYLSKHLVPFRCDPKHTKVGRFKDIDAIIEDPQSVRNDISTFAGRMERFSKLFGLKDAIVGVDEIELGTDADEAAALFRVLLLHLSKQGVYFIVTTHHKRLASLMASEPSVKLIAALYDEKKQLPTYTFLEGVIGKSYAFETALRYGIAPAIIKEAKKAYGEDKERLNELIERSTELERKMREEIRQTQEQKRLLAQSQEAYEKKIKSLESSYKQTIAQLETEYLSARKKVLEALKTQESKEGRRILNEAHRLKPQPDTNNIRTQKPSTAFQKGDCVRFRNQEGVIISLSGQKATVEIGGIKMHVSLQSLHPCNGQTKKKKHIRTPNTVDTRPKKTATVSLRLLGLRVEEARERVEAFLSDALLEGLHEVEIIHGVGTGALSAMVKETLRMHPRVKHFYHPKGNFGATVVEL